MTLWRLEWLRLVRTQRIAILAAVYGAFGLLGPLVVRFLPDILESVGEDAAAFPVMTPPDAITQYVANVQQIGLLVVAFVAAAALAIDANFEIAVFFRSRTSVTELVKSRFVATAIAVIAAFVLGSVVAYVATGILLEWLDLWPMVVGVVLHAVYLMFAIAVIALVASLLRKTVAVALVSVGALLVLGIVSLASPLAPWLPSDLLGALDQLIRGGPFDYWRAIASALVLCGGLLLLAVRRFETREV